MFYKGVNRQTKLITATVGAFVCVEVLRPCQQLRSLRASQLSINTVPGQT